MENRPIFPKRAVITAGMPYGNKELHFGHIGGVFIPADVFARFMRDRIGKNNVIYLSGTDCYGSTIEASYLEKVKEGFHGNIEDFVVANHNKQKQVLEKYEISLDFFGGSALGNAGTIHKKMSEEIFNQLYSSGFLKLKIAQQFYDEERQTFLNGRQVVGRCPIRGCKSEVGYANECALGHQYLESDLINPKSVLSGSKPVLKPVQNWYIDLEEFREFFIKRQEIISSKANCRTNLLSTLSEFYKDPAIYIKKEYESALNDIRGLMPQHRMIDEANKNSISLVFTCLNDREKAARVLSENSIHYRTGKALVPFRISGNVNWGIPVPEKEGASGLTFWVWPESLWAPISFTKTYLQNKGLDDSWEDWWKDPEAQVYQFIGEDNIHFYGLAEMAIFEAINSVSEKPYTFPNIIPNHHILYKNSKASSSGREKPIKADELFDYYTVEQLRMHFLGMALSVKSVNFQPNLKREKNVFDTTLKEGNIVTNIFNRLVRSCFYTCQKYFNRVLPKGKISEKVIEKANNLILQYENKMYCYEFYSVVEMLDIYTREINKLWASKSKEAGGDLEKIGQLLRDTFHSVRVLMTLFHPMVPDGCETIREYLKVDESIWDWTRIFEPLPNFMSEDHPFKTLEPRFDFFKMHSSQL